MAPRMRLGRCCLAVVVSTTEESHLKVLERDLNSPKPRQTPSQTATFSPTLLLSPCTQLPSPWQPHLLLLPYWLHRAGYTKRFSVFPPPPAPKKNDALNRNLS